AADIARISAEVGLRTVQLHGNQSPQFAAGLTPLRFIKAFGFTGPALLDELEPWSGPRNFAGMLLDVAAGNSPAGGTGKAIDWNALASLKQSGSLPAWAPMILAGGLTPENVAEAVRRLQPYAVDVSSGVESVRGIKDPAKIRAFCEAV